MKSFVRKSIPCREDGKAERTILAESCLEKAGNPRPIIAVPAVPATVNRHSPLQSTIMSTSREGPNPLRPYYIPPSLELSPDPVPPVSSHHVGNSSHSSKPTSASNARSSFGSSARNVLSELDYSEYLSESSPSAADVIRSLVDRALWKYTSVLLSQPFEVAKTILQVHAGSFEHDGSRKRSAENMRRRPANYRSDTDDVTMNSPCTGFLINQLIGTSSFPLTTRILTLHLILHLPLLSLTRPLALRDVAVVVDISGHPLPA